MYGNYIQAIVNNPQIENDATIYYRQSNHLSFTYNFNRVFNSANLGFCKFDSEDKPVFGDRKRTTITNLFTTRYIFKLNMSFDVRVRHYWDRAQYNNYYSLTENGNLLENKGYQEYNNFDYNIFNVDLVFNWFFAPGSNLSIVYKNNIENESDYIYYNFNTNFSNTIKSPQTNSISMKLLYFIDYLYFVKKS